MTRSVIPIVVAALVSLAPAAAAESPLGLVEWAMDVLSGPQAGVAPCDGTTCVTVDSGGVSPPEDVRAAASPAQLPPEVRLWCWGYGSGKAGCCSRVVDLDNPDDWGKFDFGAERTRCAAL